MIKELESNKMELTKELDEKRLEVDRLQQLNRNLREKIDMQYREIKTAINTKIEELYKE